MSAPTLIVETYNARSSAEYPPIPREATEVTRFGQRYQITTTRWDWPVVIYELCLIVPAVKQ
jgi:hypothetical protein